MSKRLNKKTTIPKITSSLEADLKYALDSGDAQTDKIKFGNQKGLRDVVTIAGKHFSYNPKKITKTLANRLTKLLKNNKKYKLAKDLRHIYVKHRLNNALQTYAIRYKPTTTEVTSAFKAYTNAYSISDIKMKGLKGLSYLKYQYDKLHRFLNVHPNMKILIVVDLILDEGGEIDVIREVQSRRYDIYNSDDLKNSLNNMAKDIELQIETKQFHKSGLVVKGIDSITIQYDRYNPTRGASYIELPDWIAKKKHALI